MKRILTSAFSLMVITLLSNTVGFAQTFNLNVPFEFSAGQKTFPAGVYQVVKVADHTVALRNTDNEAVALFMTEPMASLTVLTPKLKFVELEDGRFVLSEVWASGGTGYKLSLPRRHAVLALNGAALQ